ncbi:MAG: hypothetical protein J5757_03515 [Lachnospiraceae bacterium]|nr:hypothetical protein [Lachnospiraceae bacterium]
MRKVKKSLALSVLAVALVLSACLVYGYGNEAHGSIEELDTTGINHISTDKTAASATTTTNIPGYPQPPAAVTSVNATFYWVDYNKQEFGDVYLSNTMQSSVTVNPGYASNRYYYQVVSNHYVWYGQGSWSSTNLTTFVP